jgi:hypothetical protein
MLGPALAVVAASLSVGGPPTVLPDLPGVCVASGGADAIALACDPQRRARQIDLTLGVARASRKLGLGIAERSGAEPLLPGETLTLTWRHPSASAVLSVQAKTPAGVRRVVLGLPRAPERVTVTARPDGGLRVDTSAGGRDVAPPPPEPSAAELWHPRTARAAAFQLLGAVDRMGWSVGARTTLCASMDPGVRSYFEPQIGDYGEEYPCEAIVDSMLFGDENVPRAVSTTHRGLAVEIHGGRAVVSTRLVHRFRKYDDPRRLSIRARVLLVRDGHGIWRLGTLASLLPLVAVDDPHHVDSWDDLEREYLAWVKAGRRVVAHLTRLETRRGAATVQSVAAAPCAAPLVSEPVGDVVVDGSYDRARDQSSHSDVDAVAFAAVGRCLVLQTTAALPSTFSVDLSDEGTGRAFDIKVTDGRTLVEETTDVNDGVDPKPLRGVVAHLGPDGLVLALPATLSGKVRIELSDERPGVAYGDVITSAPAPTRRCARPTC